MKILYLVPHVPNPTKIRSYMHVNGLLEAGHDLTVVTLERTPQDTRYIEKLRARDVRVISVPIGKLRLLTNTLSVLPTRHPLQSRLFWSNHLMNLIENHIRVHPPDVIHVEHLRMAGYGIKLAQQGPVVFDAVDAISQLYQHAARKSVNLPLRLISILEAPRLQLYEQRLTSYFPVTTVISTDDERIFRRNTQYADRVRVIPMGVPLTAPPDTETQRADNMLIITGTWNYHPNVAAAHHFVKHILPLVQARKPDIRLQIVGANPAPSIQKLASAAIEVTGFVTSIHDYLRRATIAVAPITYGAGMQIKVLEAFMTATPLVATQVALRGLDVRNGEHVQVANTPEEFAATLLNLLDDASERNRLGAAGRHYIEKHHDLRTTIGQLSAAYQDAITAFGS